MEKTPQLIALEALLDELLNDPVKQAVRTKKLEQKREKRAANYVLPKGVRISGDIVVVPGTSKGTEWEVKPTTWTCNCPAFLRWPPCKHVVAVRELVKQ